jgi:hypothetical protein
MRCSVQFAILAAAIMLVPACASRGLPHLALPTGAGEPAAEYSTPLAAALLRCHDVRTLSAELSLSGHAGDQKLRGRVLAGLVAGALRLEAPAPGGAPVFILVADGPRGRLLLGRDRRVLNDAPPADILDALVGIAMGPDDLRALLSGCLQASVESTGARAYGAQWLAVDLAAGGTMYLHRGVDGAWRIVAGMLPRLLVQYGELVDGVPSQIRLTSPAASGRPALDLTLGLSQAEVNTELPRDQLVALIIPPGTAPLTLQELRESYHR